MRSSNDLQDTACAIHPSIKQAIQDVEQFNPLFARMSGSGASCFAVFDDWNKANVAKQSLSNYVAEIVQI